MIKTQVPDITFNSGYAEIINEAVNSSKKIKEKTSPENNKEINLFAKILQNKSDIKKLNLSDFTPDGLSNIKAFAPENFCNVIKEAGESEWEKTENSNNQVAYADDPANKKSFLDNIKEEAEKKINDLPSKEEALDYGISLILSQETRATSIKVDSGVDINFFDYGKNKKTIAEKEVFVPGLDGKQAPKVIAGTTVTKTEELGAKLRLFGHASAETLSASLGAETEIGYKNTKSEKNKGYHPKEYDKDKHDYYENKNKYVGGHNNLEELFIGVRGRCFGEIGALGATLGAEAFGGLSLNAHYQQGQVGTSEVWTENKIQFDAGARLAAMAHIGITGIEAFSHAEVGLRYREEDTIHFKVYKERGIMYKDKINVFAGAEADANFTAGFNWKRYIGMKGSAGVFAGVKAEYKPEIVLANAGKEVVGAFGKIEVRAGIGADAHGEMGYDKKEKKFSAEADAGAACGVGYGLGGGVSFYGIELGDDFTSKDEHEERGSVSTVKDEK